MAKQVYKISEADFNRIISEEVKNFLAENMDEKMTWTDMFGAKTRQQNRINTFSYARQYGDFVNKIEAIEKEIDRRVNLLQAAQNGQMNEAAGALAKVGAKLGIKGVTKAGAKQFAKKAGKVVGVAGLASIPAFIVGPQNIQAWLQKFNNNRGQSTPQEVITAYDELTEWMRSICTAIQEHPEIIGAKSLEDKTLNGPEEVQSAGFGAGDVVELAAGMGMYAIPYVGWALGAIDLAHSIVHAAADANREGLEMVGNQIKYLNTAIADVNRALSGQKAPQNGRQQTQQQPQQMQQQPQTQQAQVQQQVKMPNGYVKGQPAPFANSDPQQVARLQGYFGLQSTGRWDRNTQSAWDNWLTQRYQA